MRISCKFALPLNKCILNSFLSQELFLNSHRIRFSVVIMRAILLWILLFFYCCGMRDAQQQQQPYCAKIDFNQANVSGFRKCTDKYLPMLDIKKYIESPWLQPYRPSSEFYLSNTAEGYSCAESTSKFHLNANSEIEAAIFLNFQYRGAFIEVVVYDTDSKKIVNQWKNETSTEWFMISKKIGVTVRNAQVLYCIVCVCT